MSHLSLRVAALLPLYRAQQLRPRTVIEAIYERIAAAGEDHVWICRTPLTEALRRAEELEAADPCLPLYGIPFAVKDNIDVEGFVTTAGCPAFAYTATRSAKAVQTLLDAGAIFIGKTNLDQFATGLAGVRSPYGVPRNPFDSRYIPGGSSSGSAVAVASGLVSFALGTDTAGSGRVPAALNNIAGWKPTPGAVSSEGVVPACRSLDCLSVFALTCGDAALVARTLTQAAPAVPARTFRFGVPAPDTLEFFGDPETPGLFQAAIENLTALGGTPVTVDIAPLREVALLLYEGPWLAERTAALKDFLARHPGDMLPVTRSIIEGGAKYSAVEAFEGLYRLAELKQVITPMWEQIDTLLLPTVATTYTVAEVEADPIVKNSNLGYYTNFVNLLGYAGVSVPSGFTTQGLPFGVTLIGSGGSDDALLRLGDRLHRLSGLRLGATQEVIPSRSILADGQTIVAVAGAHLRGLPLNQQLLDHDALFVRASKTAPVYRLYELPGSLPPKPGLVRVAENGVSIAVELWQMPLQRFGEFVDLIPPPLGIGSLTLDGGEVVKGFLCEPAAVASARDISGFGGWKAFLASHAGGISTGSARTATSTVCSP